MLNGPSSTTTPIRILTFGEILWDILPEGKKLGGAPVNFSYHAKTQGADVRLLTRIGADYLGREIQERLSALGLSQDALQISPTAPTGTVDVLLDANGNPTYRIVENVAWDEIKVDPSVIMDVKNFLNFPKAPKAFYFGSLALRSTNNKESFKELLQSIFPDVLRICDLNLRAPFYDRETIEFTLDVADVYKLNDLEAIELSKMFSNVLPDRLSVLADENKSLAGSIVSNFDITKKMITIWADDWFKAFHLTNIILTCGSEGAFIIENNSSRENIFYAPASKVDVKDCVGAGDSFTAVCTVGLLARQPLQKIVDAASKRAAFVCSREGGTPEIPDELAKPFE